MKATETRLWCLAVNIAVSLEQSQSLVMSPDHPQLQPERRRGQCPLAGLARVLDLAAVDCRGWSSSDTSAP